jgi:hypothetical protein
MAKKQPAAERRTPARKDEPAAQAEGQIVVIGRVAGEMRGFGDGFVTRSLDAGVLKKNLDEFMKTMGQVIDKVQGQFQNYQLDTIKLKADLSASGSVSLLGSGGKLEGSGGLEFTFKRLDAASNAGR